MAEQGPTLEQLMKRIERMERRQKKQEEKIKTLEEKMEGKDPRIKEYSESESDTNEINNNNKGSQDKNESKMKSIIVPMEIEQTTRNSTKASTSKEYKVVIRKGIIWIREDIRYWIQKTTGYKSNTYTLEELSKKGYTRNKGAWVLKTCIKDLKEKLENSKYKKGGKAYEVEEFKSATQRWIEKEKMRGIELMRQNGFSIREDHKTVWATKKDKTYEMKWNENMNKYVASNIQKE
ncbi:hypothetical protein QAD02_002554 [Eretmocerus hayati]|uniref:Uncharacterized protein n=1 Tax=Eretmocerus hayati TaxID=131215 RepID=A0ACC2NP50_9HYME|nr:hypothetical protein QAD02_002554 [Eretmocerus hayati]